MKPAYPGSGQLGLHIGEAGTQALSSAPPISVPLASAAKTVRVCSVQANETVTLPVPVHCTGLHFSPAHTAYCFATVFGLFLASWGTFYAVWRATLNRTGTLTQPAASRLADSLEGERRHPFSACVRACLSLRSPCVHHSGHRPRVGLRLVCATAPGPLLD